MRRGFTLIELMISAVIFASVLMMTFTVYALVGRNGRIMQIYRTNSTDGATLVDIISQYGRYATPWLDQDGAAVCTRGLDSELGAREALARGVYDFRDSSQEILSISIRNSNQQSQTAGYSVYRFIFTRDGEQYVFNGQNYSKYAAAVRVLHVTGSGLCDYTVVNGGDQSLLPDDLRVVGGAATPLFVVNNATSQNSSIGGGIAFNVANDQLPQRVDITLGVANIKETSQAPFNFVTSFTTRTYASTFMNQ